jgi:hypothetical protein
MAPLIYSIHKLKQRIALNTIEIELTLGLTNNALNLENTLNISFAFFAVANLSLKVAVI